MKKDGHSDSKPPVPEGADEEARPIKSELKTLGLPGQEITEEQRIAIAREQETRAAARRAALHHWTEEEVFQYIEAFKIQKPSQYAEYLEEEIHRNAIETDLMFEMHRFAASIFPQVSLIDITHLLGTVRKYTRDALRLEGGKKDV